MIRKRQTITRVEVPFDENVRRHLDEVRELGGSAADIAALEALASEVDDAAATERRYEIDLARALSPYTTAPGWIVAPPTTAARFWARAAVLAMTGGRLPGSTIGEAMALGAGLLVLRMWGDGHKDLAVRLATRPTELAEKLADEMADVITADPDELARDWMALTGTRPRKKVECLGALLDAVRTTTSRLQGISQRSGHGRLSPTATA